MTTRPDRAPVSRVAADGSKEKLGVDKRITSLTPLKLYLLAYNALSALLWFTILLLTISFLLTPHSSLSSSSAQNHLKGNSNTIQAKLLNLLSLNSALSTSSYPYPLRVISERLSGSYHYQALGSLVKWTQSLAVLEVVHSALGWVRSPVGTTAAQVASRLWTVWGVVEACPETHNHPLFTSMIFAWSLTETIRYAFYECALLRIEVPALTWARYSLFTLLYPIGASSEAFLSFSTLPPLSTFPLFHSLSSSVTKPLTSFIANLPSALKKRLLSSGIGRSLLWRMAQAGMKSQVGGGRAWGPMEVAKLGLFCVWWPSLYALYTYMLKQRKKVLGKGKGRVLGGKKTN